MNLRNSHQVDKLITRKFELLFQYLAYMHLVSFLNQRFGFGNSEYQYSGLNLLLT